MGAAVPGFPQHQRPAEDRLRRDAGGGIREPGPALAADPARTDSRAALYTPVRAGAAKHKRCGGRTPYPGGRCTRALPRALSLAFTIRSPGLGWSHEYVGRPRPMSRARRVGPLCGHGRRECDARLLLRRRSLVRHHRRCQARPRSGRRRAPTWWTSAASPPGPGASRVDEAEELRRVVPVVRGLASEGVTGLRRHHARRGRRAGGRGRRRSWSTTSAAGSPTPRWSRRSPPPEHRSW